MPNTDSQMDIDQGTKRDEGVKVDGIEPYQEPADALKYQEEMKWLVWLTAWQ